MMVWRPMNPEDLTAAGAIADRIHAAYPEDPGILAERLSLYSRGCFVLSKASSKIVGGYCVSHPWRYKNIPALNVLIGETPKQADAYYLHDIVVLPEARGQGAASEIVDLLVSRARADGFMNLCLVAIAGKQKFWRKQGFSPAHDTALNEKLASYGPGAAYMARQL